jgi:D-alanyl-lipoteichoic acid acyltransferase DltB (MBOAT superfamily)
MSDLLRIATEPVTSAAVASGVAGAETRRLSGADPREARSTRHPIRFGALLGQLALLLLVFRVFHLETPAFLLLSSAAFAGFAVHYWLPFRMKETFTIGLSLATAYLILEPLTATLLIAVGLAFFGVLASRLSYRSKLAVILAAAVLLMAGRATEAGFAPPQFWPVFGAIFMFRMMVYLYDLRHMRSGPSLKEYLSYFFLLPNYYFLLFPVVDFQTLRRSYYQRDIHVVAQQGVGWMARGAMQLLLYRLVYHLKPPMTPDAVTTFGALVAAVITTYLLYLRVSGQFHIIVGMLHLFGYDLPETHRRYLLASSLTDFWRRINIYWKDFMVKLVYFPVYFRMRRSGDTRAQLVATGFVFTTTWLLHSYQWFWLKGEFLFTWPDTLFWGVLGVLVALNLLWEGRRKARRGAASGDGSIPHAVRVVSTFCLITLLWSLWNSPTLSAWFDLLTWWEIG